MGRRPVIGITSALEGAAWGVWRDTETNLSPRSYSLRVSEAGAIPIVLPSDAGSVDEPDPVLDMLDALVLAGGQDVDPATYGAEPDVTTRGYRIERDRFELALAGRAIERDMPVLGLCRGMQLLNIARGGTLIQDLEAKEIHVEDPGTFSAHAVRLEPGSLAARAVGAETIEVHSHHHQGIDALGSDLVTTGWSEPDGLPEAIEMPSRSFVLGLEWHPEEVPGAVAFKALVDACGVRA